MTPEAKKKSHNTQECRPHCPKLIKGYLIAANNTFERVLSVFPVKH